MRENSLVILINGWGNDGKSAFFPELAKSLESKGYKVFSPDLPNSLCQDLEVSSNVIKEIIRNNPESKISLVGHSSGGYLAAKLAEEFQIENLVLAASTTPKSVWSKEFSSGIDEWLSGKDHANYLKFHSPEFDFNKIIKNSTQISLIFGEKDPYIDEKAREYFKANLENKANIQILPKYGHMGEDEGTKKLEVVEILF